jgi:hypothetical protein
MGMHGDRGRVVSSVLVCMCRCVDPPSSEKKETVADGERGCVEPASLAGRCPQRTYVPWLQAKMQRRRSGGLLVPNHSHHPCPVSRRNREIGT